jgi:hypothetical protein
VVMSLHRSSGIWKAACASAMPCPWQHFPFSGLTTTMTPLPHSLERKTFGLETHFGIHELYRNPLQERGLGFECATRFVSDRMRHVPRRFWCLH